jgi:hypothetical protein
MRPFAVLVGVAFCIVAFCVALLDGQEVKKPEPVKFAVSQTEQLQLDALRLQSQNLRLRQQLLDTQRQLSDMQMSASIQEFAEKMNQYTKATLKAHGDPARVSFDPNTMGWVVK